jgi:hypothetical protein
LYISIINNKDIKIIKKTVNKMTEVKLMSGVFLVRPNKLLTLNAGGMIKLTPKKIYKAFKTNYEISNQPGQPTIMIVKEDEKGLRWFPVNMSYAKNNFYFVEEEKI